MFGAGYSQIIPACYNLENNYSQKENTLKKIIVAALAVVSLAGCATSTPVTVDDSKNAVQTAPNTVVNPDDKYLAALHAQDNLILRSAPDADLVVLGRKVCEVLDSGVSVETLATNLVSGLQSRGADAETYRAAGAIVGAAIPAYCPSHEAELQRFLSNVRA